MSKHTPGPWKVNKDYKGRTIIDCNDDNICIMDSLHEVDIKHNARLIAAAPEMYEALEFALIELRAEWGNPANAITMIEKALAKVEEI